MLTNKQRIFLDFIINCYKNNMTFPSVGYLKKNSIYKSYNTIYKYLIQLEKKNYIKLDGDRKKIIYVKESFNNDYSFNIPIVNENYFLNISSNKLKSDKNYLGFRVLNNKLNSLFIKSKDILIFEKTQRNLNNKIILVLMNDKYKIFKYIKKDGFVHLQNDINTTILTNEVIVGKCVSLIRETMD